MLLLWAPAAAPATQIHVTSTEDTLSAGQCSLRAAIFAANEDIAVAGCPAGSGADTVLLPAGHYVLSIKGISGEEDASGDLDVLGKLAIVGEGAASTTIDANGIDRVLTVLDGATATIEGVTITGGHAPDGAAGTDAPNETLAGVNSDGGLGAHGGAGGGVLNLGSLTLVGDVVKGNAAGTGGAGGSGGNGGNGALASPGGAGGSSIGGNGGSGGAGGGIYSNGQLTIISSRILENRAGAGGRGGDAATGGAGGNASTSGAQGGAGGASSPGYGGDGGPGGGIAADGGALILQESEVSGNVAGAGGEAGIPGAGGAGGTGNQAGNGGAGGLSGAEPGGVLVTAGFGGGGGGIYSEATSTISDCTISANFSGAGGVGFAGGAGGAGGVGGNGTGSGGAGGSSFGSEASSAGEGGGVFFQDETATLTMTGSTLSANTTGDGGDGGAGGVGGTGGGEGGGGGSVGSAGISWGSFAGDSGAGSAIAIWGGMGSGQGAQLSWSTVTANANGDGGNGGSGGSGPGESHGSDGGAALDAAVEVGLGTGPVSLSHLTVDANAVGSPGAGGSAGSGSPAQAGSLGEAAEGGGIQGPATLGATIVSGNAGDQCVADIAGSASDGGFDLSFPDATCPGIDAAPLLAALADNGGPTATQQLLPGSAAHGAIPVSFAACTGSDQRGVAIAPVGACDIGAYEAEAPGVSTSPVSGLSATAATLDGEVAANGPSASVHFEWGTTSAYGSSTSAQSLPAGVSAEPVAARLEELAPGTTYHYRLVATNQDGTSRSADATLTTPAAKATSTPAAFAGLRLARQKVRLSAKGVAAIEVSCPASTQGRCSGRLTLASRAKAKGKGKGKAKAKAKAMKLGSVRFAVAAGAHATLHVKLSKRARVLVAHAKRFVVTATAVAKDGLGRSVATRAQITLLARGRRGKA